MNLATSVGFLSSLHAMTICKVFPLMTQKKQQVKCEKTPCLATFLIKAIHTGENTLIGET